MNPIRLISHASQGDQHSSVVKPETIVEGEVEGLRMRMPMEAVHYREDEASRYCAKCHGLAEVWLGREERWEVHPMRCNGYRGWRR